MLEIVNLGIVLVGNGIVLSGSINLSASVPVPSIIAIGNCGTLVYNLNLNRSTLLGDIYIKPCQRLGINRKRLLIHSHAAIGTGGGNSDIEITLGSMAVVK